jgi:hypothetical protein
MKIWRERFYMDISAKFNYRKILLLFCIPFFNSCASPYLFGPAKYGTSHHFEYEDESKGGLAGDAEITLHDQGSESVIVGWEHFFGTNDDFDKRIHNHIYRGAVKFNVGLLGEPPPKTITKATLIYRVESGARSPSSGFILSCATRLFLAKNDWHGMPEVEAPETFIGDPYKEGLSEAPLGSKLTVDVTDVVKDWASGKRKNNGFIFVSAKEEKGVIVNNDKCWTMLGGFVLQVDYTKP